MAYSTFRENGYTPGKHDMFKISLDLAREPYVIGVKVGEPNEPLYQKMISVRGVKYAIHLNDMLYLSVDGKDNVENAKRAIYDETRLPIGAVRYIGQDLGLTYADVAIASDIAIENGERYHEFNPEQDSLQAIVQKSISELRTSPN